MVDYLIPVEKLNLSKMIQWKEDNDIFRHKRSLAKYSGKVHGYFAVKQNEENKEKQFVAEIKLKQDNQFEKYRSYCIEFSIGMHE